MRLSREADAGADAGAAVGAGAAVVASGAGCSQLPLVYSDSSSKLKKCL